MIDIGANLAHGSFDADRDAVLHRAWAAGVEIIIVTGSDAESSRAAAALAQRHPGRLYATAGLHPHHASEWNPALADEFRALIRQPGVVSLGECGLDYHRNYSTPAEQRIAFAAQLALAVETGAPLFLHQRDAHVDFLPMLRDARSDLAAVCVHCFTDQGDALDAYLELDCHIGITGWICDPQRGAHLLDLVGRIPADRLLIETDAPYLLPRSLTPKPRDRRNEPAFLPWVRDTLAAARSEDPLVLGRFTALNARHFFRLPEAMFSAPSSSSSSSTGGA